jgi:hypothetical protein
MKEIIKICPNCSEEFSSSDLFRNPEIVPVGMLFDDSDNKAIYLFQHEIPECQTSFAVYVEELRDLVDEPSSADVLFFTDCCEEHCVTIHDLSECKQECQYAPYRRLLMTMIKNREVKVLK